MRSLSALVSREYNISVVVNLVDWLFLFLLFATLVGIGSFGDIGLALSFFWWSNCQCRNFFWLLFLLHESLLDKVSSSDVLLKLRHDTFVITSHILKWYSTSPFVCYVFVNTQLFKLIASAVIRHLCSRGRPWRDIWDDMHGDICCSI